MKNLLIKIFKDAIISDVDMISAYAGLKLGDDFERIATAGKDSRLLSKFWAEACSRVVDKLKSLISSHSLTETALQLTLSLSGSYDESLNEAVETDLATSVAMGVSARWFRYSLPDKAAEWEAEASASLESAFSKLCYRRRPSRQ